MSLLSVISPGLGGAMKQASSISSLGGSMNIPIPSLTGGDAAPSSAVSGSGGNVYFGDITKGIGFFGMVAIIAGIIIWKKLK